jgi:PmbA protein
MSPAVEQALARARELGATGAEVTLTEGEEFSVTVRLGEIEKLVEAGSRAIGIRVLVGQRAGSSYTSDLTREGVEQMVRSAVALARIASEDPFAGLPEPELLGAWAGDLALYHEDVAALDPAWKIEQARLAEKAALGADPRITNSEGASFDTYLGRHEFANSLGFAGAYRTSSCSLSVVPVARAGDSMERDWWHTAARAAAKLEAAEEVGRTAAARALRRLHARKAPTQRAPVVFEARVARSLLGHLFEAASGTSVYRKASYLAEQLGERIAAPGVTVVDDATLPGLFGSAPFDDEGVASRRTVLVENGVLRTFLHNCYTARKLGMRTTGNASRGVAGNPGVGHGNFYLEPGAQSAAALIGSVRQGLYVTELIGSGVNTVTGDYSRGAAGQWIENGELAYPVSEITIAGNLRAMFAGLAAASDLEFRGSTASPTVKIEEMTISGQ